MLFYNGSRVSGGENFRGKRYKRGMRRVWRKERAHWEQGWPRWLMQLMSPSREWACSIYRKCRGPLGCNFSKSSGRLRSLNDTDTSPIIICYTQCNTVCSWWMRVSGDLMVPWTCPTCCRLGRESYQTHRTEWCKATCRIRQKPGRCLLQVIRNHARSLLFGFHLRGESKVTANVNSTQGSLWDVVCSRQVRQSLLDVRRNSTTVRSWTALCASTSKLNQAYLLSGGLKESWSVNTCATALIWGI